MTGSTPLTGCRITHHRVAALGKLFTIIALAEIGRHIRVVCSVKTIAVCRWFTINELLLLLFALNLTLIAPGKLTAHVAIC